MSAQAPVEGTPHGPLEALRRAARAVVLAPITAYQRLISPAIPRRCKYEPTCSRYAVEAVREYGILRGLVLAGWRLLRCNPWSYGGYDPVEAQRVFRTRPDGDS
jgi:putative membrane protein insertion efficiency factor